MFSHLEKTMVTKKKDSRRVRMESPDAVVDAFLPYVAWLAIPVMVVALVLCFMGLL